MNQANNLDIKKPYKAKRSASMKLDKSEFDSNLELENSEAKKRDASANAGTQKSKRLKIKEDNFLHHQNDVEKGQLDEHCLSGNMTYRIGDWVFCEFEENQPYAIRQIEDFYRIDDQTYEAKLRCAYRRTDISPSLLEIIGKRYSQYFNSIYSTLSFKNKRVDVGEETVSDSHLHLASSLSNSLKTQISQENPNLNAQQMHELKHRELFYSKFIEPSIPVSLFRGKVSVNLFMPDVHTFGEFLSTEEKFFYQLKYDPNQKVLSADRIEIREGAKYQAEIPDLLSNKSNCIKEEEIKETLVWNGPESCQAIGEISMKKYINKFVDKKLQTNEKMNPNCEINETRDNIMYDALIQLHEKGYDRAEAMDTFDFKHLKNEAKVWTQEQMAMFAEGIIKHGKNFFAIKREYFPDKELTSIVEYFYNVYKISDVYIERRNAKRENKKNKLIEIQVSNLIDRIPSTNEYKMNVEEVVDVAESKTCVSCLQTLNPANFERTVGSANRGDMILQFTANTDSLTLPNFAQISTIDQSGKLSETMRSIISPAVKSESVCNECWLYWKKYGSLRHYEAQSSVSNERPRPEKRKERLQTVRVKSYTCDKCSEEFHERQMLAKHALIAHCLILRQLVGGKPVYKHVHGFCLQTTQLTRDACARFKHSQPSRRRFFAKLARNPMKRVVDAGPIKREYMKSNKSEMRVEKENANKKSTDSRKLNLEQQINRIKNLPMPSQLHIITNHSSSKNANNGCKSLLSMSRPLTPLSPFLNDLNENSTSSTLTNISNRSFESDRFLSIDCAFKASSFTTNKQKSSLLEKQKQESKSSSNKSSYVCLSPSPSPTPSPKSNSSSVKSEVLVQVKAYSAKECLGSFKNTNPIENRQNNEETVKSNGSEMSQEEETEAKYSIKPHQSCISKMSWYFRPSRTIRAKRSCMSKVNLKRLCRGSFKYKYKNNSTIVKVDFDQIKQNLYRKHQNKQDKFARCRRQQQQQSTQNKQNQFKANNQILEKNKKVKQRLKTNIQNIPKATKTRLNNKQKS